MATPIEQAPNIGPTLAAHLRNVGIETLEALVEVGDAEAYARLAEAHPGDANAQTRLELAESPEEDEDGVPSSGPVVKDKSDSLAKRRKPKL